MVSFFTPEVRATLCTWGGVLAAIRERAQRLKCVTEVQLAIGAHGDDATVNAHGMRRTVATRDSDQRIVRRISCQK